MMEQKKKKERLKAMCRFKQQNKTAVLLTPEYATQKNKGQKDKNDF